MNAVDKFMQEEYMPFYRRVYEAFKQNHPGLFAVIAAGAAGKKHKVGIRVSEGGAVLGDYTLNLDGTDISRLDSGVLASEVHTPFGIVRPYVIVEKSTVERMIADEENFIKDPFATKMKYAREVTIKFL